ncbi:MAG: DUF2757 family protein [Firmicutes bacterium]|nr:DUF2757 family protein [Bacillota bacterium]
MVRYICRQCGRTLGRFSGDWREPRLGLTRLSPEDQDEVMELNEAGDVVWVKILCEDCLPVPWDDDLWYN